MGSKLRYLRKSPLHAKGLWVKLVMDSGIVDRFLDAFLKPQSVHRHLKKNEMGWIFQQTTIPAVGCYQRV